MIEKALEGLPALVEQLGNKKFLLCSQVQMVDFLLFEAIETVLALCNDKRIFYYYPKLEAYFYRMKALPGLCEYMDSDKFLAEPFFIPDCKVVMRYPFPIRGEEKPLVTITGITGYVGSHVAKLFLQDGGFRVRGTVRDPNNQAKLAPIQQAFGQELFDKMELVAADLLDDGSLGRAISGSTYVIHVASPVGSSMKDEADFVKPAVTGTKSVLKACKASGVQRLVITSSFLTLNDPAIKPSTGCLIDESYWNDVKENTNGAWLAMLGKAKLLAEKAAWEYQ